jgi:hypothetical protein
MLHRHYTEPLRKLHLCPKLHPNSAKARPGPLPNRVPNHYDSSTETLLTYALPKPHLCYNGAPSRRTTILSSVQSFHLRIMYAPTFVTILMIPFLFQCWSTLKLPNTFHKSGFNVHSARAGLSVFKQSSYIYIYIHMSCKEYMCIVYLHTAVTRSSERNFDFYGKGPPWGTIWGPAWAPWGPTWDTIWGQQVDNSEGFQGSVLWGLMGLFPFTKSMMGAHGPGPEV